MRTLPQQVRSLRIRTTAVSTVVVALVLTIASVALIFAFRALVVRGADDLAKKRASEFASQVESGQLPAILTGVGDDTIAQVVDEHGSVLGRSVNSEMTAMISRVPSESKPVVFNATALDDGEDEYYRMWARRQSTPDGMVTVYVGTARESTNAVVFRLIRPLAFGLPLLVLVSALLLWFMVGRMLRPVARSAEKQLDFVANAAHELQSPIAAMRTQLEVDLAHPTQADATETLGQLLEDTGRMESLVRDLLFLARQDTPAGTRAFELLDLDDVVLDEVRRVRTQASVALDTLAVGAAPVHGNRDELTRLVRNVLENAVRHASSRVSLSLTADDKGCTLEITDDGPGIEPDMRERVFDRFQRGDAARSHESGSTGLGLAIARAIATQHRGTLTAEASDTGARLVLHLPAS